MNITAWKVNGIVKFFDASYSEEQVIRSLKNLKEFRGKEVTIERNTPSSPTPSPDQNGRLDLPEELPEELPTPQAEISLELEPEPEPEPEPEELPPPPAVIEVEVEPAHTPKTRHNRRSVKREV